MFVIFLFGASICYCSYQLVSQFSVMNFLGYFLFMIIVLGLMFIFFDLDIFTLFLWMIYGGFMAAMIIFLLAWGNSNSGVSKFQNSKGFIWGIFMFIFSSLFLVLNNFENFCAPTVAKTVMKMKYLSECLVLDTTLELEVLGWGLVFLSSTMFLFVGMLLTLVCYITVQSVMTSAQLKWVGAGCLALMEKTKKKMKHFVTLSTQNFFIQESGIMGMSRRIMKTSHHKNF